MAKRKALLDAVFGESGETEEQDTEPIGWEEIMGQPNIAPAPKPRKKRESTTGPFTVDGEKDFCRRWNRTVNLFRAHFGLPLFEEDT